MERKKLSKIKLTHFSKAEMEQRAMKSLLGGESMSASACTCSMWSTAQQSVRNALGTDGDSYGGGCGE
jgi:natural product precursor